jgi:hypothetical protein
MLNSIIKSPILYNFAYMPAKLNMTTHARLHNSLSVVADSS